MTVCPDCGAARANRVSRGALTVQLDPPGAWWRGLLLKTGSGRHHRLLHLLCARGEATHFAVELVAVGEDAADKVATVVVCQLRKRLPHELQITSIHGWGYRLEQKEPT